MATGLLDVESERLAEGTNREGSPMKKKSAWQLAIGYLTAIAVSGCGAASESVEPGGGTDAASVSLDLYQAAIEDAKIAEHPAL